MDRNMRMAKQRNAHVGSLHEGSAMHEYLMKPAERRRSQRIRAWLLQQCDASPVYAQCLADPKDPFWYKVFFYTPHGVWKCDTGKEYAETKADARLIIRLEK